MAISMYVTTYNTTVCPYTFHTDTMSSDPSPPVPPPPMETPSEPDADENISHPSLELYRHTILRGANMGSFLALVVGPPVLFFRGVRSPAEMMRRMAGICAKGMVSRNAQL